MDGSGSVRLILASATYRIYLPDYVVLISENKIEDPEISYFFSPIFVPYGLLPRLAFAASSARTN